MRSIAIVVALLSVLFLSCQTTAVAPSGMNPLQGNWELVSARFTSPEGTVSELKAPQLRSLKVLGPTHFSFITLREDGTLARAAGGRYTVRGNQYIEHIELSSAPVLQGDYVFEWRIEGDTWYHRGSHEGRSFDEVWRRVR